MSKQQKLPKLPTLPKLQKLSKLQELQKMPKLPKIEKIDKVYRGGPLLLNLYVTDKVETAMYIHIYINQNKIK